MTKKQKESDVKQAEINKNYTAFKKLLPEIVSTHPNKFLLMRDGNPVEYFDTAKDAFVYGSGMYEDDLFSVQKVDTFVSDLG